MKILFTLLLTAGLVRADVVTNTYTQAQIENIIASAQSFLAAKQGPVVPVLVTNILTVSITNNQDGTFTVIRTSIQ